MRQTLVAARQLGVAAGAHPGYPDRANFGRVESALSPGEIEASVLEQIASLAKSGGIAGHAPGARKASRRALSREPTRIARLRSP